MLRRAVQGLGWVCGVQPYPLRDGFHEFVVELEHVVQVDLDKPGGVKLHFVVMALKR
jgi:hypothetical protein